MAHNKEGLELDTQQIPLMIDLKKDESNQNTKDNDK